MGGILGGGSGGGGLLDPLGILGGGKGGGLLGGGGGGGGLLSKLPDPLGIGKLLFGDKSPDPTQGMQQSQAPVPAGVQYAHQQQSAVAPGYQVSSPMGPTGFGVGGGGGMRR